MKLCAIVLMLAMCAGCAMSSNANTNTVPDPDGFDGALADFQKHLEDCPYPGAHVMVFARRWNIPEFVVQAYVPKTVIQDRGKTN